MSRLKKLLIVAAVIIIIAAVITGVHFKTRTHYSYTFRYKEDVDSTTDAYEVIEEHMRKKEKDVKLMSYGAGFVNRDDINNGKPSEFSFSYFYAQNDDIPATPEELYFVTFYLEKKKVEIVCYKFSILQNAIEYQNPIIDINYDEINRAIKEEFDIDSNWDTIDGKTINKVQIGSRAYLYGHDEIIEADPNKWAVDIYTDLLGIAEYRFVVNLTDGKVYRNPS